MFSIKLPWKSYLIFWSFKKFINENDSSTLWIYLSQKKSVSNSFRKHLASIDSTSPEEYINYFHRFNASWYHRNRWIVQILSGIYIGLIRPEVNNFWNRKSENVTILWLESLLKLLTESYSRFFISRHQTAVGVVEVSSVAVIGAGTFRTHLAQVSIFPKIFPDCLAQLSQPYYQPGRTWNPFLIQNWKWVWNTLIYFLNRIRIELDCKPSSLDRLQLVLF